MASLRLEHIRKIYDADFSLRRKRGVKDRTPVVDDFCLEVEDREFVVLVGPSGCGKSTTLRMIAGLETITSGDLYIDGKRMNDVESKDRDISMVFQNYALYPHMTVAENIAFPLQLRHVPKDEIRRRVEEVAGILGIGDYLHRKPKALSGGQRQRVAIGRAIVRAPKVLLMDEPLSNLDAKLRNQMRAELIELRRKMDTTFVYVTHDQTEAMTLGDRLVVLSGGRIQQVGTPHAVYHRPANRFVADFIGVPRMNHGAAELVRTAGEYRLTADGVELPLCPSLQAALAARGVEGQAVLLGVRPERMRLAAREEGLFAAELHVVERMGSSLHLHLRAGEQEWIVVVPSHADTQAQEAAFRPGSMWGIDWEPEALHLFAADGEQPNLLAAAGPEAEGAEG